MTASSPNVSASPTQPRRKVGARLSWRRLAALLLLVAGVPAAAVWGYLWWQERPLAQAEELLSEAEADQALSVISDYLRKHPQHPQALGLKGRALVALERYGEAVRLYEQFGPADPKDHYAWGHALVHLERWSEAHVVLKEYLELRPEDADALHEITACRTKLGLYEEALKSAHRYAAQPGHEDRGWLLIGMIHRERGNDRSAIEAWMRAVRNNPDASDLQITPHEFFLVLGRTLQEIGRPTQAVQYLEKSIEHRPTAEACGFLGDAQEQLGQLELAEAAWRRGIELQPDNQQSREGLARISIARGQPREALEWIRELLDRRQLASSTAFLAQRAWTMLGDEQKSREWQAQADRLRNEERSRKGMDRVLADSAQSFWGDVVRAYKFAEQGNWVEAENILLRLRNDPLGTQEQFFRELAEAVHYRGPLPSPARFPLKRFD